MVGSSFEAQLWHWVTLDAELDLDLVLELPSHNKLEADRRFILWPWRLP